jgi:short-subunit dehydrogenase
MKHGRVLITGAASGIGLALAKEFAKHGHNLFLTSRVRSELREVAGELTSKYNIEVGTIAADLQDPGAPEMLFDAIQPDGVPIDILVNNAGIGFRGRFWEIPIENQLNIVRVNIEAVMRITHLFLPEMIRRIRGAL